MPKSRWQTGFEALAQELRKVAAGRRHIVAADPAADGIEYSADAIEQKVRALLEPTTMLTPEEWAAEQDPPVAAGTARRWCRDGELEHIETPRGYLIPVGTERKPKKPLQLMGLPVREDPELPAGTVEVRTLGGKVVGRLENVAADDLEQVEAAS